MGLSRDNSIFFIAFVVYSLSDLWAYRIGTYLKGTQHHAKQFDKPTDKLVAVEGYFPLAEGQPKETFEVLVTDEFSAKINEYYLYQHEIKSLRNSPSGRENSKKISELEAEAKKVFEGANEIIIMDDKRRRKIIEGAYVFWKSTDMISLSRLVVDFLIPVGVAIYALIVLILGP